MAALWRQVEVVVAFLMLSDPDALFHRRASFGRPATLRGVLLGADPRAAEQPHRAHEAPLLPRQYVASHVEHTPVPGGEDVASHVSQFPPAIALQFVGAPDVPTAHDTPDSHPPRHTAVSSHSTQYLSMGLEHDVVVPHKLVIDVAHEPPALSRIRATPPSVS